MSNKKYKLLELSIKAMEKGAFNLLIARGETGMGKTYNILKFLKGNDIDFAYIKTYATPLKFYELLYKNRNKQFIVFDDLGGISDPKVLGIFKSACWCALNGDREVSYHTTSRQFKDLNIPSKFKINAKIILIFNNKIKGFEPITNRGVNVDFDFTFKEKLSVLEDVKAKANIDDEIMDYVKKHCSEATKNLSIRSLVILTNLKEKGFDWEMFAQELLKVDCDTKTLIDLRKKEKVVGANTLTLEETFTEWKKITGKSRSTFMRIWAKIKPEK